MVASFTIQRRPVGPGHPMYVIAELSGNHLGDYDKAVALVRAAKKAGADAVKLQTYTADTITIRSDRPEFRVGKGTLWTGKTLHDLYEEAHTPWSWQPKLKALADRLGVHLFSSPFDRTAVDFLRAMKVPAYKVASFEIVDLPLIRYMAKQGKPLIVSTGMSNRREIADAVHAARGAPGLALLRCNSAYPAPPGEMDLRTIPDMVKRWRVPVGLSDHTLGSAAAVASVALGATLLEKHLCLDRRAKGPDTAFSMEPDEFAAMVGDIRDAEAALGGVRYGPSAREQASLAFRRSLYVVAPVGKGERFTERNVRSIRPANGLAPKHLDEVLGRRAKRDVEAGTPLSWSWVA